MNLKTIILPGLCLAAALVCAAGTVSGQGVCGGTDDNGARTRTHEAEQMLATLKALPEQGVFMSAATGRP